MDKLIRRFEFVDPKFKVGPYPRFLPVRSTSGSAGYDFYLPKGVVINPGETKEMKSNVKVYLAPNEELHLRLRSSAASRGLVIMMDTIDTDYVDNPTTGGNISIKVYLLPGFSKITLEAGERIIQGVVQKFEILDEEKEPDKTRVSGLGSTGKF